MKKFTFQDFDSQHVLTEDDIIKEYFAYWSDRMRAIGKEHLISRERCIEDFCVVHWASEIKQ